MSGISVREHGEDRAATVELSGEFDLHDLEDLRRVLDEDDPAPGYRKLVDLSGVTFLDIGVTRELVVRSQLHARHMMLVGPSPAVLASVAACGLDDWFDFAPSAATRRSL